MHELCRRGINNASMQLVKVQQPRGKKQNTSTTHGIHSTISVEIQICESKCVSSGMLASQVSKWTVLECPGDFFLKNLCRASGCLAPPKILGRSLGETGAKL